MGMAAGLVSFLIIWLTQASGTAAYLIFAAVMAAGLGVLIGPDRVRLWRQMHGSSPRSRNTR